MKKDELAKMLNGRQYGREISALEESIASDHGLLVVFGASDDLVEFRGVIHDEAGAYYGTNVRIAKTGRIISDRYESYNELIHDGWTPPKSIVTILVEWCPENFDGSWRISADCPNATFDIMEGEEFFCRGIVIDWHAALFSARK